MTPELQESITKLRKENVKADAKTVKATESKERAQKTLTKARKAERDAQKSSELSLTKIKLMCAENNLDFEKTLADIDAKLK